MFLKATKKCTKNAQKTHFFDENRSKITQKRAKIAQKMRFFEVKSAQNTCFFMQK